MSIPLFTSAGEPKGQIDLKDYLGEESVQVRTLHEAIVVYQGNRRQGTSATKTRGLVSGGGRKPWKQKGTGNARSGSIRSPLWRKGGIIFGPQPRSYRVDLPEEKRRAALKSAILLKDRQKKVFVVENLSASLTKTKNAAEWLKKLSVSGRSVVLSHESTPEQRRAFANLPRVTLSAVSDANAYDITRAGSIVFTLPALQSLAKRFLEASHG